MIIKSKDGNTMIFTESGVSLSIQPLIDVENGTKYMIMADSGFNGLNMGFFDTEEEAMMMFDNTEKAYCAPQQGYNSMCKTVDEAWQKMLDENNNKQKD